MQQKSFTILENKVTLYNRGGGSVWHARIKLKTGEWWRFSTKQTDFEEAKEIALKEYYTTDYKHKNNLPQNTRKFKSVAIYSIKRMEDELAHGGGKTVFKDYIRVINDYLIPFFDKYDIASINMELLYKYSVWRDEKIKGNRKAAKPGDRYIAAVTQSTLNTHNSALNRVFDEALLRGWITNSIRPTLLNKGKKSESRGAFTDQEYKTLYTKLRTWWKTAHTQESREQRQVLREYVLFLANTGIRHGTEAINLKWKNLEYFIDKDGQRYLVINVDGKRGKREAIARQNTTDYLERLKDLNPKLKDYSLDQVIQKRLNSYLFVSQSGKRISSDGLRGSFRQLLRELDLETGADGRGRSLYSLRHTYATFALRDGRDIHKLALQMGTSVKMLEQFYSKLSPRMNAAEHAGIRPKQG